jgi:SAM-dependent methyltransferase
MHANALLLLQKYANSYFQPGVRVLEIGPDFPHPPLIERLQQQASFKVWTSGPPTSSLQEFAGDVSMDWHTLDIYEHPKLTYTATDPHSFPVPDEAYDIVAAANVLEHVRKPWLWIKEAARVCRKGGYVIMVNPASWPYHEAPIDCWRVFPEGMRALYEDAQLNVVISTFEALEDAHIKRDIPGRCQSNVNDFSGTKMRWVNRLLAGIGYPMERAYDTITIGRK